MHHLANMFRVICLLFLLQSGIASPTDSKLTACRRSDSNINSCILNQLQNVLKHLQTEYAKYNVDTVDPLNVEFMSAEGDLKNFYIKSVMKNITLYGITEAKFDQVDFKSDSLTMEFKSSLPTLRVTFDYFATGKLFTIPLESSAHFDGNITNTVLTMNIQLQTRQKKNKEYFTIDKLTTNVEIEDARIDLVSIDSKLQPQVNVIRDFYNENVQLVAKTIKPFADEQTAHFYKYVIEKYLRKIPASDFLPY